MTRISAALKQEDGNALMEFALVLPIVVFVMMAAIDFSLLIQKSMRLTDAAASGARYAALIGNGNDFTGIQTAAINASDGLSGIHVVASNYCRCIPGGAIVSCSSSCSPYLNPAEYVKVTTTATVPLLFGVSGIAGSWPLSATSQLRIMWIN